MLSRLTEEEQKIYLTTITTGWTPVEIQNNIYVQAAEILFPLEQAKCIVLGKAVAEISYTTVYRTFLRIMVPEAVAQRWVKIWKLHHDSGLPSYEMKNNRHLVLTVRGYPGLPSATRQLITGHVIKIVELVGIKSFTVNHMEDNPESWRWEVLWEK